MESTTTRTIVHGSAVPNYPTPMACGWRVEFVAPSCLMSHVHRISGTAPRVYGVVHCWTASGSDAEGSGASMSRMRRRNALCVRIHALL